MLLKEGNIYNILLFPSKNIFKTCYILDPAISNQQTAIEINGVINTNLEQWITKPDFKTLFRSKTRIGKISKTSIGMFIFNLALLGIR